MAGPTLPPSHHFRWAPSPSPSAVPATVAAASGGYEDRQHRSWKQPVYFSPPLIAMVAIVAAAFLLVAHSRLISRRLYPPFIRLWRRWRRLRRRRRFYSASSTVDIESLGSGDGFHAAALDEDGFHVFSPYGLDEAIIKTIPLSAYTAAAKSRRSSGGGIRDCAVCLIEFEDDDWVRTLPACSHAFHVDCIDVWLRSHANCPMCRAGIFRPDSPFVPLMAARIRPSLDGIIDAVVFEPPESEAAIGGEIRPVAEEPSPMRINIQSDDHLRWNHGRDFLLKRSYSFGFERSFPSERLTMEPPATASPWRYRRGSFWSKRPSPFGSLMSKPRVFSLRYYRGMKSPFFRRRSGGGGLIFPLSESRARFAGCGGGGGGSSRRSKSMTSPMFGRPGAFPSSRLRCGDLEALLSPDRYGRR